MRLLFFIVFSAQWLLQFSVFGQGTVSVYRDSFGVAHVFGETHREALFGLAYAHAEDNFADIERMFIMSRGRLGELEGVEGAKADLQRMHARAFEGNQWRGGTRSCRQAPRVGRH